MNIRIATPEDAFAIQNIYRYYVDNTAITFELEVPSVEEFQFKSYRRIIHIIRR